MLSTRWQHVTTTKKPLKKIKPVPTELSPSIHHQHIIKRTDCNPLDIISSSSSTSYFLPLLPSFSLLFFLFVCLSHCLFPLVRTLYSCTRPFCSSSGGGCQDTRIAVPLSPLPVTVTPWGAALGAVIRDTSGMLHTPYNIHVCLCMCIYLLNTFNYAHMQVHAFINKHYAHMHMDYMSRVYVCVLRNTCKHSF